MKLSIIGQKAEWLETHLTVYGSEGIYKLEVEFADDPNIGASWDDLAKRAVYKNSSLEATHPDGIYAEIVDGEAEVPAAILFAPGLLYVGVIGEASGVSMPTVWAAPLAVSPGCGKGEEAPISVSDAARQAIKYGENAEVYAEGGYLVTDVQGPIEDPILIREETYTEGASDYADAAAASATAAEGSKDAAALSAQSASDSKDAAAASATAAEGSKDSAALSAQAAAASASSASDSKDAASLSAVAAAASASAALDSKNAAAASASAANDSATAAAGSKDAAAASATAASGSASAASVSAGAANDSKNAAALSAQSASDSKDAAALSAGAAASSATDAATAKTAAETARDASVAAKTDAESAKNAAAASATAASNSASAAGNSATAAGNSATAAGNAKIAAEAAAERAEEAAASVSLVDYAYLDANAAGEAVVTLCGDKPATPGDIVSFSDGAAVPVKSLTVAVEAVQEGSGDPSPTNVRPITGRSGVWLHRYGLPEGYTEADYIRLQGTEIVIPASPLAGDDVIVTLHFRYSGRRNYAGVYRQYTNESTNCTRLIQTADTVANNTLYLNNNTRASSPTTVVASQNAWHTLQSSRSYVLVDGTRTSVSGSSGSENTATDIYIGNNIPTVSTDYRRLDISKGDDAFRSFVPCTDPNGVPGLYEIVTGVFYAPTDATRATAVGTPAEPVARLGKIDKIPFVDGNGNQVTCYGGTLAYLGGNKYRLTVNMVGDLTPLTWTRNTTEQSYAFFYAEVDGRKGGAHAILSSELTYVTGGRASLSANNTVSYYSDSASDTRIAVRADDYADAASFGRYMLGVQIVYELEVPRVFELTADELKTALGDNTLWAGPADIAASERLPISAMVYRTSENSRTIVLGTTQAGLLIALAPLPVATGEEF